VIEPIAGVDLFITPQARAHVAGAAGESDALQRAEEHLKARLLAATNLI
jgi:hypothetical protein